MTVMDKINYDVTFPSKIRDAVKKKFGGPFPGRKERASESGREMKREMRKSVRERVQWSTERKIPV